ncbi:hypothetical protein ElyMa_002597000 [Elysia marginata]|uniref:LITAF domain-containing protein n=1 Tax=Elysia marginata TaxID=1093978 RepID=A0AAV4H254_9GAST|nr:hypothetical protein ElyMa_002597000 [Elysia marginata]
MESEFLLKAPAPSEEQDRRFSTALYGEIPSSSSETLQIHQWVTICPLCPSELNLGGTVSTYRETVGCAPQITVWKKLCRQCADKLAAADDPPPSKKRKCL